MSWKHCGPGRRGYHHGNLREALIQSALSLIGEKGPAGFTIAEAARSAGVSPAAPYRHFRDREELMAEVASLGLSDLRTTSKRRGMGEILRPSGGAAKCRAGLSRLRSQRACLLCRDVRNGLAESPKCRPPGVRQPGIRRALCGDKEADRETAGERAVLPARWLLCTSGPCRMASPRFSGGEIRKRNRRSRLKNCWRRACFSIFGGWAWREALRPLLHFDVCGCEHAAA